MMSPRQWILISTVGFFLLITSTDVVSARFLMKPASSRSTDPHVACENMRDDYKYACHKHPLIEKGATLGDTADKIQQLSYSASKHPPILFAQAKQRASLFGGKKENLEDDHVYKAVLQHALALEPAQMEVLKDILSNGVVAMNSPLARHYMRAKKVLVWNQCIQKRMAFVDFGCPKELFGEMDGDHQHAVGWVVNQFSPPVEVALPYARKLYAWAGSGRYIPQNPHIFPNSFSPCPIFSPLLVCE